MGNVELVKLLINTNLGKKGDLVPDPTGNLVKQSIAVKVGVSKEEVAPVEEVKDSKK